MFRDLTGHRYGLLTVLSLHSKIGNNRKWNCRCDCGNECVKYGHQIRAGTVVSCGCEHRRQVAELGKTKAIDLTGKRFGRLVVIARDGSNGNRRARWLCKCDCGKEKTLLGNSLVSGNSESCGCIQKETMHKIRWNPNLTQEDREANTNREMAYPRLHLWRKAVYARDHYTCQACGTHISKRIIAHHKEAWSINKELRMDIGNGVTSCVPCHKEFHDKYGWGKNTTTQWDKFIESKNRRIAI